jgi:hypothetical protein
MSFKSGNIKQTLLATSSFSSAIVFISPHSLLPSLTPGYVALMRTCEYPPGPQFCSVVWRQLRLQQLNFGVPRLLGPCDSRTRSTTKGITVPMHSRGCGIGFRKGHIGARNREDESNQVVCGRRGKVLEDELNTKVVIGHPRWDSARATHVMRRVCLEIEECIFGGGGLIWTPGSRLSTP